MHCEKCKKKHDGRFGSGRFCSRACANSRTWSDYDRLKKSVAAAKYLLKAQRASTTKYKTKIEKFCPICECIFFVFPCNVNKFIVCSRKCSLIRRARGDVRPRSTKNMGGYRAGSGRAKSGYYKGIYCGSTYELVWVIYQLDHSIHFERFHGLLRDNGITYIPDFIIGNMIIEIKGFEDKCKTEQKVVVANNHGYDVTVLYKKDLQHCFKWVHTEYRVKNDLFVLYDQYKPKYEYICKRCGQLFGRAKKARTHKVICSRYCTIRTSIQNGQSGLTFNQAPKGVAGSNPV